MLSASVALTQKNYLFLATKSCRQVTHRQKLQCDTPTFFSSSENRYSLKIKNEREIDFHRAALTRRGQLSETSSRVRRLRAP